MTDTIKADTTEIRRHPDGSINTRHYMEIGRQRRSKAFYDGGRMGVRTCSALSAKIGQLWCHVALRKVPGAVAQR